jgi:hypothetical protein
MEHSDAKHLIGGRYFKPNRKYCFTCYDTGIGITGKVKKYYPEMTDKEAIQWALMPGNSTALDKETKPRGQGLGLLKSFVKENHGTIRICTGNILYTYSAPLGKDIQEKYECLTNTFLGTLFEMDIYADDKYYKYRGEEE